MAATNLFGARRGSRELIATISAISAAFVLGGATGYVAHAVSLAPAAPASQTVQAASIGAPAVEPRPVRAGVQPVDSQATVAGTTVDSSSADDCLWTNRHKAC